MKPFNPEEVTDLLRCLPQFQESETMELQTTRRISFLSGEHKSPSVSFSNFPDLLTDIVSDRRIKNEPQINFKGRFASRGLNADLSIITTKAAFR